MKISLDWLNDFVSTTGINPEELAVKFSLITAEVEKAEEVGSGLKNAVAARVLEVRSHPNADKLVLAKVDTGSGETEVVCGAPNAKQGITTVLLPPGSVLPNGMLVKDSKVRGVQSPGMLAAADELGIGDDHEGIVELPFEIEPGTPLEKIASLPSWVLEIDNKSLTHRPDLWSHYGIAREIAAIYDKKLGVVDTSIKADSTDKPIKVTVENYDLCPRYMAVVLTNFTVKPSPLWMQARLTLAGMRPVNNIVDITNYVMLETGQPLHAFDADRLAGKEIIVRTARKNESIKTLDGTERKLDEDMLAICDAKTPVAVAGVMGGELSEITANTKSMVLESACFSAPSVRRTASKLKLRTEAVARFEKSLDPHLAPVGLKRFVKLLTQTCPEAKVASVIYDEKKLPAEKEPIKLDLGRVNTLLGAEIPEDRAVKILEKLGFGVRHGENGRLAVSVPSFRATRDISIPEDLVEEIGRFHGYDNLKPKLPVSPCAPPMKDPVNTARKKLRAALSGACGLSEVWTHSFMKDTTIQKIGVSPIDSVKIKNPINMEETSLKTSLIFNLLEAVERNHRNYRDFGIFEIGRSYHKNPDGGLPIEREEALALLYSRENNQTMFYEIKGLAELALRTMGVRSPEFSQSKNSSPDPAPWIHPVKSQQISKSDAKFGAIYEVHPATVNALGIEGAVFAMEIDVKALSKFIDEKFKIEPIQKFPPVTFDLSILVNENLTWGEIRETVAGSRPKNLENIAFVEVYQGEGIPQGKKSVTFSLVFRSQNKTLDQKEAEKSYDHVLKTLREKLQAEQR